jgi:hypothetical protein
LIFRAEAHNALYARAIVPTAVEDHDFSAGRQVRQVSLNVHLRFFALCRRRQRNDAENPRTDTGSYSFDGATLSGAVTPLKDDADLAASVPNPLLKLNNFPMEAFELLLEGLPLHLAVRGELVLVGIEFAGLAHAFPRCPSICHSNLLMTGLRPLLMSGKTAVSAFGDRIE